MSGSQHIASGFETIGNDCRGVRTQTDRDLGDGQHRAHEHADNGNALADFFGAQRRLFLVVFTSS